MKKAEKEIMFTVSKDVEVLKSELRDTKGDVHELKETFQKYVTNEKFRPVELIVYGMVGGILLAVLSAFIAGVVAPTFQIPTVKSVHVG